MALNANSQGCLFEENYLVRTLGPIANSADIALTELVANAWDAGASKVDIVLPEAFEEKLSIADDGTGMTEAEFRGKWMRLGYDRVKHQGSLAEFPPEKTGAKRRAYGRNGVGRHGMLCFAPEYQVATRREGLESIFEIATTSGDNPFEIASFRERKRAGHGTVLSCTVSRNLPSASKIADLLSARFLHDPQFLVAVNGKSIPLAKHSGLVSHELLRLSGGLTAEAFFVDSATASRNTQYQGVAFWVGGRLVGDPGWAVGGTIFLDGRTRVAKRYTVVIKTDDFFDDVQPDWSGFKRSPRTKDLFSAVSDYVQRVYLQLSQERLEDTKATVLREHREELQTLGPLGRSDIDEFVTDVTSSNPTIAPESLSAAVEAAIRLEKIKGGSQLLEKLSKLSEEDVSGLDRLLSEWTVRDALIVLDEIERRLAVCEAINRLSVDPKADELHSLHPLILESRWLFGPEFDSPEYVSNVTLNRALRDLFDKHDGKEKLANPRRRADVIVLPDRSISGSATENIDEESGVPALSAILLLELKRGASEITRENIHQTEDYLEDLLKSGLIDGAPQFRAFVIGHSVSPKIELSRKVGDRATLHVVSYGQIVRLANRRLFRLRDRLAERYSEATSPDLVDRVLSEPEQLHFSR